MFKNVDAKTLQEKIKSGEAKVIDCREEYEYEEGHIPGSINMPTSNFLKYIKLIDKTNHYYIICLTGSRSHMVARYLDAQGYNVTNVVGGIITYQGPIEA
jgi:rhodanese-related sulfurtransferase